METLCERYGLDLVHLLPPNSTPERIQFVTDHSRGFVYLVSVIGITGAREALPLELEKFVQKTRQATDKPLAVGFGISTPEQAAAVGQVADGVIVGSALIKTVAHAENPIESAREFVKELSAAIT